MSSRKAFPFISLNPNKIGLEKSKELVWIIPNKLGGYSSTTAVGLNTSRFHGLLVSGCKNLNRMLYLQKLDDEISLGSSVVDLSANEYSSDRVSDGCRYLNRFEFNYASVSFQYKVKGVNVNKQINPLPNKNALMAFYSIDNNSGEDIVFRTKPLLNSRDHRGLTKKGRIDFIPRFFARNVVGVDSGKGYVALKSDNGEFIETPEKSRWSSPIFYSEDGAKECSCCPAYLSLEVEADTSREFIMVAVAYPTEYEAASVFKELLEGYGGGERILSSGKGTSIFSLLNVADTFIVDVDLKKTIIAGYPRYGERGRDAMIALPGLTLTKGNYKDAEKILERFMNHATCRGIPSGFSEGKPHYKDIDTSLWLIDRLYQYIKYVGIEEGRRFLHTYWWILKDIINNIGDKERDGILTHRGKTWMGDLERKNAVEVQGLWYNALRIMEYFAGVMEDEDIEVFKSTCSRIEERFLEAYWNGRYLSDSLGDDSLRPNQVILLALDHHLINDVLARKIMAAVERELLTPYGLRSMSPNDSGYEGAGEESLYNGGIWPWLLGSYIKAHMRIYGSRLKAKELLEQILSQHINDAGVGTMSEALDGDPPFKPRGCISYSCSVSELLRCYFEDIMKKKPSNERQILYKP